MHADLQKIAAAQWRTLESGPIQVVSGALRHEEVHFEAPQTSRVKPEMDAFLHWLNSPEKLDPVLKAGVAHFWFISIHPFEDGNGRIARAITDMLLARGDNIPERFYSLSSQIERECHAYYDILASPPKGGLDITPWLAWFIACLGRSIKNAGESLNTVLRKSRLWQEADKYKLNDRQRLILSRLADGFEGRLTSSEYAKLAKCSPDTALRDLKELVAAGLLVSGEGGGRSTHYKLN